MNDIQNRQRDLRIGIDEIAADKDEFMP